MLWSAYDELIAQATQDADDVRNAKAEWEKQTGTVRPDHELYNERSDAFVEWYLLERQGPDGTTAVERALAAATDGPTKHALRSLRAAHRSLFRVHALRAGGLRIDDLCGGGRFDVDERRRLPGVQLGDLFEARLFADLDQPYRLSLGRAILFHPREATETVLLLVAEANKSREPPSALLARLSRLRLRALAYRHVAPARIYAQAS